jgi:diaminopropionate ammonia-lyase
MEPGVRANPRRDRTPGSARLNFARSFHARLPDAAPTPLLDLRPLADELGLGGLLVKDESARLGLQSYEVLGAAWALYRAVLGRLGRRPPRWQGLDDLRDAIAPVGRLRVVAADDAGFGAGAARAARLLGFDSVIYVPATIAPERVAAVEREGGRTIVAGPGWEDAVSAATAETGDEVVRLSDSSWDGFDEVPMWVTEGYATVFEEIEDELEARGRAAPDAVVVPLGVGALASAAASWFRVDRFSDDLWLVGSEPAAAAVWSASIEAGAPLTLSSTGPTAMDGLARGQLSPLAWPVVEGAFDAVVAVADDRAVEAASRLADHGVRASPSGAAAFAGLLQALVDQAGARGGIPLGPAARVLVVVTEGALVDGSVA